jgi:hypothetical protein
MVEEPRSFNAINTSQSNPTSARRHRSVIRPRAERVNDYLLSLRQTPAPSVEIKPEFVLRSPWLSSIPEHQVPSPQQPHSSLGLQNMGEPDTPSSLTPALQSLHLPECTPSPSSCDKPPSPAPLQVTPKRPHERQEASDKSFSVKEVSRTVHASPANPESTMTALITDLIPQPLLPVKHVPDKTSTVTQELPHSTAPTIENINDNASQAESTSPPRKRPRRSPASPPQPLPAVEQIHSSPIPAVDVPRKVPAQKVVVKGNNTPPAPDNSQIDKCTSFPPVCATPPSEGRQIADTDRDIRRSQRLKPPLTRSLSPAKTRRGSPAETTPTSPSKDRSKPQAPLPRVQPSRLAKTDPKPLPPNIHDSNPDSPQNINSESDPTSESERPLYKKPVRSKGKHSAGSGLRKRKSRQKPPIDKNANVKEMIDEPDKDVQDCQVKDTNVDKPEDTDKDKPDHGNATDNRGAEEPTQASAPYELREDGKIEIRPNQLVSLLFLSFCSPIHDPEEYSSLVQCLTPYLLQHEKADFSVISKETFSPSIDINVLWNRLSALHLDTSVSDYSILLNSLWLSMAVTR